MVRIIFIFLLSSLQLPAQTLRGTIVDQVTREPLAFASNGVTISPKVNKEQPLDTTASVSARVLSVEEARRFAGGFDDPARLVSSFAGVSGNICCPCSWPQYTSFCLYSFHPGA